MVVFTFVNNGNAGYFIAASQSVMGWQGVPLDLDREMKDVKAKGEEVEQVSIGRDGDWFLRTSHRHACKTEHGRADMISNVELFVQHLQQAGVSLADYAIQFFTFVPDATGYITVLHKTDGSLTRCAWRKVPEELDQVLEREGPKGVRHVTVGVNGSYVVILNSGAVWWGGGVPPPLHQLLEDAERRSCPVETVSLSLLSPSWYFVKFADGATNFVFPSDWHQSVNYCSAQAMDAKPKMATSFNHAHLRSQTYPQYSPQPPQAQFGFNPGSQPTYGGSPNPGQTLFQSNPYLSSAFTGMQQQQQPMQQPVYNITNVYTGNNPTAQQTQQQEPKTQQQEPKKKEPSTLEKYNGVLTALGNGALKIAEAVLVPALKQDLASII